MRSPSLSKQKAPEATPIMRRTPDDLYRCYEKSYAALLGCHKSQVDKSGIPYTFHPIHLAEQMQNEETTIVALLHDVVEDSSYTFEDLESMGFSEGILTAVKLLTREPGVPYMEYIAKIKENPIVRTVKLADLAHNSDLSRLKKTDEKVLARVRKYEQAIRILNDT